MKKDGGFGRLRVLISDEEFLRIANYLKGRYGIDMGQKKIIMNGRLENYIKREGWKDFSAYMDALQKDSSGKLEKALVDHLTTNHTFFMREFEHFEFFRDTVLPYLRDKERARKDLRIWCGASSTGEEPYMIAMMLREFFGPDHKSWDTKVLATDISTKVLQKAITGIYRSDSIASLPEKWKKQYLKKLPAGDQYAVIDDIKREVIFRQFNLMNPFPFKKKMHTVFLRNVMIYFDAPTKRELVQKVYNCLEPGGYLFIGTTETLDRGSTAFQLIRPSIFRK